METAYRTAAEALADKAPGSRLMQCTLKEAFAMAGKETVDVAGRRAWYCTPISQRPGQSKTDPLALWVIAVSTNQADNEQSIGQDVAAQQHWL